MTRDKKPGTRTDPEVMARRAAREIWRYHTEPAVRAKFLAVTAVGHALKRGGLKKPACCSQCGVEAAGRKLQAHHHKGYAPEHQLDVVWLCEECHNKLPKHPVPLPDPAHAEGPGFLARVALPLDQNPAAIYLASKPKQTRWTMENALRTAALVLSGRRIQDIVRDVDWTLLRVSHVKAIRARLVDVSSPQTANKVLVAIRGVAREAWEGGLLPHEEFTRIDSVKGLKVRKGVAGRALSEEELAAIFEACRTTHDVWTGLRNAVFVALGAGAGLRREELIGASWADFDGQRGALLIRGKGGKERWAPIVPDAVPLFVAWNKLLSHALGDPVLPFKAGSRQRIPRYEVNRLCARLAERAGVLRFTPHDLRRTFATRALRVAGLPSVQFVMGHENPATTELYDRRGMESHFAEVSKLTLPVGDWRKKP